MLGAHILMTVVHLMSYLFTRLKINLIEHFFTLAVLFLEAVSHSGYNSSLICMAVAIIQHANSHIVLTKLMGTWHRC